MDEPIGALDADARETMRAEIKRLHLAQAATTVYVTHDQIEAMAMGDRIVVMSDAVIQQVGAPADVYHKPANLFVARFIGSPGMNLLPGRYADGIVHLSESKRYTVSPAWKAALQRELGGEGDVILAFRPEAGKMVAGGPLEGQVYASDLHGAFTMLHLSCGDELVHLRAERGVNYPTGASLRFDIDPEMVRFFDPGTETALTRRVR